MTLEVISVLKRIKKQADNRQKILTLCRDFKALAAIPLGGTGKLSYDRCGEVSNAFCHFCLGRGVKAKMLQLNYPLNSSKLKPSKFLRNFEKDDYGVALRGLINHWIVIFQREKLYVDWTARQFWPKARHPWIMEDSDLVTHWGVIHR